MQHVTSELQGLFLEMNVYFGAFDGFCAFGDFGAFPNVIVDSVGKSVGSAVIVDWVENYVGHSVGGDLLFGSVLLQKAASYAEILNKGYPESYCRKYPSILNVSLADLSSPIQE